MATWSVYKTLCGLFNIYTRSPDPTGSAGIKINDNFGALADALEYISERAGTRIYYGQVAGTSGDSAEAVNGDYFLDVDDGKLYIKSSGSWVEVVTLKGTNGNDGTNGTRIYSGQTVGVGDSAEAVNGDYFLDVDDGKLYIKSSGSWVEVVTLKGSNGVGITAATVNALGHLILTYSNSTTVDCGNVAGSDGSAGWTDTSDATATPQLTFSDGSRVNLTHSAITTISVDLATGADCAAFMFLAGSSAPSIDDPVDASSNPLWHWLGDDCADGVFSPVALTEYSCIIDRTPRGIKVYVGRI